MRFDRRRRDAHRRRFTHCSSVVAGVLGRCRAFLPLAGCSRLFAEDVAPISVRVAAFTSLTTEEDGRRDGGAGWLPTPRRRRRKRLKRRPTRRTWRSSRRSASPHPGRSIDDDEHCSLFSLTSVSATVHAYSRTHAHCRIEGWGCTRRAA